jgi:hypothetical protein
MDDADLAVLGHLNLAEFCRESTRWGFGGAIEESDDLLLFATGTWVPVLANGAILLGNGTAAPAAVARAEAWFATRERGYTVLLRQQVDAELSAAAESAGLVAFGQPGPEMVCRHRLEDRPPPPGIELRWVGTAQQVADFAVVNRDAYATYGMPDDALPATFNRPERFLAAPHVLAVVAYDADAPVAAAMTLLSHGIAGVYWVGTVASARTRGLGECVTRAVTNVAFDLGARANTLQASIMGQPIYQRMGYETLYHYDHRVRFARPPGS